MQDSRPVLLLQQSLLLFGILLATQYVIKETLVSGLEFVIRDGIATSVHVTEEAVDL
jgi:hypothetical protein